MKELILEKRICQCCGSDDLELIWSDRTMYRTRTETYIFNVFIVICRKCGFCFNSPCPKKEDLDGYYKDSLSISEGLPLAYSIESRIEVIKKYGWENATFIEIGGNQSKEFHKKIAPYVNSVQNIELNQECRSDYKNIKEVVSGRADIVAHYDTLEHITDVTDFLLSCCNILKDNGIMICEVPDIRLYPRNLMLLSFEHVNHFSGTTLARIAQSCGFKLIEFGHTTASRPFSFVAVFRKDSLYREDTLVKDNYIEYIDNLSCLREGLIQINHFFEHIRDLQKRIIQLGSQGKKITLWCVTDFMWRLLESFKIPDTAIVVDSDLRKNVQLKDVGIPIFLPEDYIEHIRKSELLVIFSPRNKMHILDWIKERVSENFDTKKIEVVGIGSYGEPLQV